MSKINEIQNKINELNGGEFQKMMDIYFSKTIDGEVYSIGSVIGNNNTKTGTPDTLIKTPENKYIFIEYTVQKNNLYKKFEDDLDKCLDESKTNISLNDIEKIICCCTGRLSTEEISKLASKVSNYNIRLELLTLDAISFKIYEYPAIASDFLNITLDTEQILDIDDFVKVYNRSKLATTLNTTIYARDSEIDLIIDSIYGNQITILSGKPGVGKTRIALECVKRFKETNPEYEIKCLRNNGQNLYKDLKLHFNSPGSYLLFIDDVNHLTQLNLILEYLGLKDEGIEFKLIVSVREYAESKMLDKVSGFNINLIKIDVLEDKDIETLCKEEYDIKNYLYIERICKISKGNARLAIMACETAIRENTLKSIRNVIELLEEYYRGVKTDFEDELENNDLLKTATIYSFLNVVNLGDDENLDLMARLTNLEKDNFLRITEKLHSMEILDIYEGEIAKISDQILSTYIFYLAVFDKKLLRYSDLIRIYFPKLKNRIIENLNSVFSYFYQKENYGLIKEEITKVYINLKEKSDENLEGFLHTFWFALEIETLIYIEDKVDQLPREEEYQINFDTSKQTSNRSEILSTLSNFSQTKYYRESLELIIKYLQKKPTEFSSVYFVLTQDFGFKEFSDRQSFTIQKEMFNLLISQYEQEDSIVFEMLLIRLIEYYLKYSHHVTEMSDKNTIKYYDLILKYSPAILEIREIVWNKLKDLYYKNGEEINKILFKFGYQDVEKINKDILIYDIKFIEELVESLAVVTLKESIIFNKINDFLLRHDLKLDTSLINKLNSEKYNIYKILAKNVYGHNYRERELEKKQLLVNMAKRFNSQEFNAVFQVYDEVIGNEIFQNEINSIVSSLNTLLENANEEFLIDIIRTYISRNYQVQLYPLPIINKLRSVLDDNDTEMLLREKTFYDQNNWLYCFFRAISEEKPSTDLLNKIYDYFNEDEENISGYLIDLDFLKNYIQIDENVYVNVTKRVLQHKDITIQRTLSKLFNPFSEINKELFFLFRNDLSTLKDAYFKIIEIDSNIDHEFLILKQFTDFDLTIIDQFLEQILKSQNKLLRVRDVDFSFVWEKDNWESILERIVPIVFNQSKSNIYDTVSIFKNLLCGPKDEIIIERRDSWLRERISLWSSDEEKITLLFYGIANLSKESKAQYLVHLLENNNSFDLFCKTPLDPPFFSWSGSEVPVLEDKIELLELIDKSLTGIKFLRHKRWIQDKIEGYKERIKKVRINEFMEDY
ncbi:hypothetical protein QRX25_19330 [Bacillus sp. L381]|uniref:hypothetical protein n=1 Tax=Bacillus TaxID=1386 RepID=UPI001BAE13BC|nr:MULTISPECIES: hypothetical protein [Bacillus]MCR9040093.1 hypothetical protein [Bacillus velezensis]QUN09586.1 hypothetical protein KEF49_19120 [Bacillus amyloliquefaciens]QYM82661.1 hypothetical protein KTJ85_18970 [Bacillus sp. 7D3]QZY11894.1 hypothetical protein K7B13_19690 [Bacillus amyloliquefaciens]WIX21714.1 hypothetical protein QRX25_19330 [Bacillus sp. L381]